MDNPSAHLPDIIETVQPSAEALHPLESQYLQLLQGRLDVFKEFLTLRYGLVAGDTILPNGAIQRVSQ